MVERRKLGFKAKLENVQICIKSGNIIFNVQDITKKTTDLKCQFL